MAITQLAKLRSIHTAAIQYPYIVLTLPLIIAIPLHTYVSCFEPALTYLSKTLSGQRLALYCSSQETPNKDTLLVGLYSVYL